MAKRKSTKGQTTFYKTYIQKIKSNTNPTKTGVNSSASEG